MEENKYELDIDVRILELLGPNLYTNIYYVLAELIANAYDADAHNVYIISDDKKIIVEDDGKGMSYSKGEIAKYLKVAAISRSNEKNSRRGWKISGFISLRRSTCHDNRKWRTVWFRTFSPSSK